ncbi:MAG TPA: DUF2752 domain-containing protein [Polyangiaceae bacterium]
MSPDPALVAKAPTNGQSLNHRHPRPSWQRWAIAFALVLPFAFAVLNEFPICPTAGLLGLPCPGCGLTRATLLLFQGEFAKALALHPLVLPLSPLYFGVLGYAGFDLVRGPRRRTPSTGWLTRRWVSVFGGVVLAAAMAVWALRFFGYFGGPVPVQTYSGWAAARVAR